MSSSLQARIHDPLWLLARQWQLGEFQGEDVGSPIQAKLGFDQSMIERSFRGRLNGASLASTRNKSYDSKNLPLETCVEREPVRTDANHSLAAEVGLQFFRFLGRSLAEKYRAAFLGTYAIKPPSEDDRAHLDGGSLRLLDVVAGRVLDGVRLYAKLAPLRLSDRVAVLPKEPPFDAIEPTNDRPIIIQAITAWLDSYDAVFSDVNGDSAWIAESLEYAFAVSALTGNGEEAVLVASEYDGGHLDWYSFDYDPVHKLGASGDPLKPAEPPTLEFLPTPVRFRGMPSTRWWEFEDSAIDFGAVETAPEDLARLLLVEFSLIYGNDFFVIPIDLNVGSLCRITSLEVTNTFGEEVKILAASRPGVPTANGSPWRMFSLSSLHEPVDSRAPQLDLLFLPPVLGSSLEGPPVEEVVFLRDEMANVAWAIERIVESPAGLLLNRFEAYQEERQHQEARNPNLGRPGGGPLAYRLASSVPPYWMPLIPVHTKSSKRDIELQLNGFNEHLGELLNPPQPNKRLTLNEEEVPREGVHVTRTYQYARWINGSTHLWLGRRKRSGRGEGSSGLRFDFLRAAQEEISFATAVSADKPIAFYRLNESAGTPIAADSSGNGNHGTLSPEGITLGVQGLGAGDTSARFAGLGSGRIIVSDKEILNPKKITMEALISWFGGAKDDQQRILEKSFGPALDTQTSYNLCILDGAVFVEISTAPAVRHFVESKRRITRNVVTHVAVTYDGSAIAIYIDGVLDKSASATGDISSTLGVSDLGIGNQVERPRAFNGIIDEVALYDKALSAERIRTHAAATGRPL